MRLQVENSRSPQLVSISDFTWSHLSQNCMWCMSVNARTYRLFCNISIFPKMPYINVILNMSEISTYKDATVKRVRPIRLQLISALKEGRHLRKCYGSPVHATCFLGTQYVAQKRSKCIKGIVRVILGPGEEVKFLYNTSVLVVWAGHPTLIFPTLLRVPRGLRKVIYDFIC